MAKSQLIKDLATNKISLEEGLQRLLVISSEQTFLKSSIKKYCVA